MTDLTKKERDTARRALENLVSRYESLREEVEPGPVQEAISEQVSTAESVIRKLKEKGSDENSCLFIYVPDGIHDQELEDELRSRVPEHPEYPDEKNVFWSSKYNNFVVRGHKEEAEKAIKERYGDAKTIIKNPDRASKPNTWQIADRGSVKQT